jgi:hypothetical protein
LQAFCYRFCVNPITIRIQSPRGIIEATPYESLVWVVSGIMSDQFENFIPIVRITVIPQQIRSRLKFAIQRTGLLAYRNPLKKIAGGSCSILSRVEGGPIDSPTDSGETVDTMTTPPFCESTPVT